ncbi:MAG: flagellar basal body-associated FliL family protein [SAR324 cluster bacterium]|nr:flagellar basal body-associated FliL family protein [SAR324 cluster bacterium]
MTEVNEVSFTRGGKMAEGGGGAMGRFIKLILAVVLLGLFGAGGFAVWLFLESDADVPGAAQATAELRKGGGSISDPHYLELGDFIVNLSGGRRYLKTNLQLLISEEAAKTYLELRLAEVKDVIVAELQTLDSEQLRDPRDRTLMKKRILEQVESLLPNNKDRDWDDPKPLKKLLITEFYLQ